MKLLAEREQLIQYCYNAKCDACPLEAYETCDFMDEDENTIKEMYKKVFADGRNISQLTMDEINEFSTFESETFERMMEWAEKHTINKKDLITLFITGFLNIKENYQFN